MRGQEDADRVHRELVVAVEQQVALRAEPVQGGGEQLVAAQVDLLGDAAAHLLFCQADRISGAGQVHHREGPAGPLADRLPGPVRVAAHLDGLGLGEGLAHGGFHAHRIHRPQYLEILPDLVPRPDRFQALPDPDLPLCRRQRQPAHCACHDSLTRSPGMQLSTISAMWRTSGSVSMVRCVPGTRCTVSPPAETDRQVWRYCA